MTEHTLLVPSSDNPWISWVGAFLSDNPQVTVSLMGEGETEWRSFANSLKNRVKNDKFEIPPPDLFSRWQDWVEAMSLSSIGSL